MVEFTDHTRPETSESHNGLLLYVHIRRTWMALDGKMRQAP